VIAESDELGDVTQLTLDAGEMLVVSTDLASATP
jgi:hypothetical protein